MISRFQCRERHLSLTLVRTLEVPIYQQLSFSVLTSCTLWGKIRTLNAEAASFQGSLMISKMREVLHGRVR